LIEASIGASVHHADAQLEVSAQQSVIASKSLLLLSSGPAASALPRTPLAGLPNNGVAMSHHGKTLLNRLPVGAYVCICLSLTIVGLLGLWEAGREFRSIQNAVLMGEMSRLRAQATRRAGHVEAILERESQSATSWDRIRGASLWRATSSGHGTKQPGQVYSAVVDRDGYVVLHSDPAIVGRQLGRQWYDRVVSEVGDDVVQTDGAILARGVAAYDMRIPLMVEGRDQLGTYHEGLSVRYVKEKTNEVAGRSLARSAMVTGGVVLVVSVSFVSLYFLILHSVALRRAVAKAYVDRVTEIGQMAAGLAHEIRNPLHTIRLNLHTFRRAQRDNGRLSPEEVDRMLLESNREIERIDRLMHELVSFAAPERVQPDVVELNAAVRNVVEFVRHEVESKAQSISLDLPAAPVYVRINPGRLRQALLNLISNASDALQQAGQIQLTVRSHKGTVEICIADDGPGVERADRQRIFEPFFSRKEQGTGLGLALVKRFVEEASGTITCEANQQGGATFRIVLKQERIS
jgi:nitrogen-specific signal transduction histidine kinase